ncbi:amino acid aminotransferase [Aquabacterium sp.]|uniref:amino acid aminotransferase n=1 Tax=Aquabacterium sp. TaxID=1872578 RepID=UPI0025B842A4|nr:amino acid aminotransferase [Aquabacterium sp.]
MFDHVQPYAGDPILSLMERYKADPRPEKVNLGIGIYQGEDGRVPQLASVRAALPRAMAKREAPSLYLPMEGDAGYRAAVERLLFGQDSRVLSEGRVATIQTLGGSGALKVGADFLRRHFPDSAVWVSDPTWDNHISLFEGAGLTVHTYPYFDRERLCVDFEAMKARLATLPRRSIVLLHPCCHNPTGVDLTPAQWDELLPVLQAGGLIPFLDMAYLGFGQGLHEDAHLLRVLDQAGLPYLLSNSFSKTFSLYGERVGSLSIVCESATQAEHVLGQLKATVRRNYSSPPALGADLVGMVLSDPALRQGWMQELDVMRTRLQQMRAALVEVLQAKAPQTACAHLLSQQGMFSYTGLSPEQVDQLREQEGIYLVRSGRLCVAGLHHGNVGRVAQALSRVMR